MMWKKTPFFPCALLCCGESAICVDRTLYLRVPEYIPVEAEISLLSRAGVSRKRFTRLAVAVSQKIIPYNVFR